MHFRKTILLIGMGVVFVTTLAFSKPKPNVLLISIDDLNDWVGCLGGHPQAKTPNIDRLAKMGTLFSNTHCQSPVCNPSRASMMTGRYPHTSGVYFLSPDLRQSPVLKDLKTLPEVFADHGYNTMAAGKIFHGGGAHFFQDYLFTGGFGPLPKTKLSQLHGHKLWDWGIFPKDNNDKVMPDIKCAKWAVGKLKEKHQKPFFIGVGFYRPHVPLYVSKKWFDLYPLDKIKLPAVQQGDTRDLSQYAVDLTSLKHVAPTHQWITEAGQWEHAVQSYLASITFVDHCLGLVLDALEKSAYADNTIVVLFSDHGFHMGEKERWAKRSLWEDGTRVPLIVTAPGHQANQRSTRPAELLDVFPTLLELAGLPADSGQEGQSLVPLMKSPNKAWHYPAITSFGLGNYSIRSTRYRYIQYLDGSRELYDHSEDPHEWNNLINEPQMEAVMKEHAAFIPVKQHPILPGKSTGHNAYAAANAGIK